MGLTKQNEENMAKGLGKQWAIKVRGSCRL